MRNQTTDAAEASSRGEKPPFPGAVAIGLKTVLLALAIAIVIVPELPQSLFLADDPVSGKPYNIIRGVATVVRFNHLWSFIGFAKIPIGLRVIFLLVVTILSFYPFRRKSGVNGAPVGPSGGVRWLWVPAITVAVALACYAGRVSYDLSKTFADGFRIPTDIDLGWIYGAEVLTFYAFLGVRFLGSLLTSTWTTLEAIIITSCLAGGLFAGALWMFAVRWKNSTAESWILMAGCLLAGYSIMFLGYVETTQLEVTSMMAFFMCAACSMTTRDPRISWRWEIAATISASLAFMVHAAGILLAPACLMLMMGNPADPWRFPWLSVRSLTRRRILLGAMAVVVPYFLIIVQPFYLKGDFGSITGGADNIMFVPLQFDYRNPVSPLISYSLFSLWHLVDIAATMFVATPLAVPLLLAAAYGLWRGRLGLSVVEQRYLLLLAVAAVACLSIPLAWNHDFGMWGDWNIAAAYLFPLNFLAWIAFTTVFRHSEISNREWLGLFLPLILVQGAAALGLLLQLY